MIFIRIVRVNAEAAAAPTAAAAERGRALQILGSDRVGNAVGGQDAADIGLALHVHRGDEFLAVEDRQHNTAPFLKMEFSAFILPQVFPRATAAQIDNIPREYYNALHGKALKRAHRAGTVSAHRRGLSKT